MTATVKKACAVLLALLLAASAALHIYWAIGGSAFLATALNMDVDRLPSDLVWFTWVLIAGMALYVWVALARVELAPTVFNQWVHAALLWFFVGSALLGAGLNALGSRFLDRWIFAPIFLILAALATLLALPEPEIE